jgi:hypothetical protein
MVAVSTALLYAEDERKPLGCCRHELIISKKNAKNKHPGILPDNPICLKLLYVNINMELCQV